MTMCTCMFHWPPAAGQWGRLCPWRTWTAAWEDHLALLSLAVGTHLHPDAVLGKYLQLGSVVWDKSVELRLISVPLDAVQIVILHVKLTLQGRLLICRITCDNTFIFIVDSRVNFTSPTNLWLGTLSSRSFRQTDNLKVKSANKSVSRCLDSLVFSLPQANQFKWALDERPDC